MAELWLSVYAFKKTNLALALELVGGTKFGSIKLKYTFYSGLVEGH